MAKEEVLVVDGHVLELIKGQKYIVEIDLANGKHQVIAHVSGKMRMNMIHILPGDTVVMEISPYDLTRGRITYRK